jgi:LuxR family transcriptional regulator, maltose regulon positive regulatory protein
MSAGATRGPAPSGRPFDFLESKIHVPPLRSGTVPRTGLVNRLRAATDAAVATVVAPAGYGKTTLLAQLSARDSRRFAWVTVDERDNDPVVLLRHIAAALAHEEPLPRSVVEALRTPRPTIWASAVPRLAATIADRSPIVLVLDDAHLLHSRPALEAVDALIGDEAETSLIVLAGRAAPRLALAPLRAKGRLVELGILDLALTTREARMLLAATGVRLSDARTTELVERCEGWAAALYLAAISIRDGRQAGHETSRLGGDDRYLADYFRSEYLSQLRPGALRFLRRTSVLARLSGALCDAVLEDEGSGRELEKIERANLFLVPLDNRREWFRYHHLFRELLEHDLVETEPDLVPVLNTRAADWFEQAGDEESALEHAFAAGDGDRAAKLFSGIAIPLYHSGRAATIERWLANFEPDDVLERHPDVAVRGAAVHALRGRAEEAVRWLDAAARGVASARRSPAVAGVAVIRAWLCQKGVRRMLRDAEAALEIPPATSPWRSAALLAQGTALNILGRLDRASAALEEAVKLAAKHDAFETHVLALGQLALIADKRGDHPSVERLDDEIQKLIGTVGGESYPVGALAHATHARALLRRGRWNEARSAVLSGREVVRNVTEALPWLALQVRLELAWALVTLRDADAAEELLEEVRDLLERVPGLSMLAADADELEREIGAIPKPDGIHQAQLTPAELRLLPLLASHLSFPEIAEQLFVSRNTIKTQALSIYRKLGVSSRSEAVAEAQRLGLEEDLHLRLLAADDR